MIVKLFDGTEIEISSKAATDLTNSIRRDSQGYVTLSGMVIKKSAITIIKPGGRTEPDVSYERIDAPDFRGQYSPAKEAIRKMFAEKSKSGA